MRRACSSPEPRPPARSRPRASRSAAAATPSPSTASPATPDPVSALPFKGRSRPPGPAFFIAAIWQRQPSALPARIDEGLRLGAQLGLARRQRMGRRAVLDGFDQEPLHEAVIRHLDPLSGPRQGDEAVLTPELVVFGIGCPVDHDMRYDHAALPWTVRESQ